MEIKKKTAFSLLKTLACAAITVGLVAVAHAQTATVDPSGTWVWPNPGRNGNPGTTNTLVLKYAGGSLTGTLKMPARGGKFNSLDIANGKLTGDQLSFDVTRTMGTNSMTIGYNGAVTADAIKGTIQSTGRDGAKRSRKWEAKRQAAGTK